MSKKEIISRLILIMFLSFLCGNLFCWFIFSLINVNKEQVSSISTSNIEVSTSSFEVDLFNLTNSEREDRLDFNSCLGIKARERAKQIFETGEFSHYYQGEKPYINLISECVSWEHAGENLAIDFKTVEAMHKALMDSPTHKANIIGDYTQAGFGCYDKVCVQFFAK